MLRVFYSKYFQKNLRYRFQKILFEFVSSFYIFAPLFIYVQRAVSSAVRAGDS